MQSLKQVLESFLKTSGLEKGVLQNRALFVWEEVVGEAIARNTTPDRVEHGVLTVKTSSPAWRQELLFKKREIITALNRRIGKNTIREIRFI